MNLDYPCKKEPRNPRNSAEKFLAFHAFLHRRKSQESLESLGFPGKRGDSWLSAWLRFPGNPGKRGKPRDSALSGLSKIPLSPGKPGMLLPKAWESLESQEEMLHAFLAFPYVQKSAESQEWFPAFQDSAVSWKAWDTNLKSLEKRGKPGINIPRFPGFSLCAKKRGKPGMIPSFPGFPGLHGFLESMEYQPEKYGEPGINIPRFPGFSLCLKKREKPGIDSQLSRIPRFLGIVQNSIPEKPGKAWKAKIKYFILSWLFPVCEKHRNF